MSPKKPYQKRLPTVLPPAPRRRPQQQAPPRAGRPPARTPGPPAVPTDPEVTAARPALASVPQPRNPEPARTTAQKDPTRELAPAAVPPQDTASPAGAPAQRGLATTGRGGMVAAAVAVVALLGVVVAVVVGVGGGRQVDDEEDASVAPTSSFRIDGWPAAGVSRTVTEVRAGGHLDVTHWIHADRPMDDLVLALPRLDDGEEVQVVDVEVVADGRPGGAPRPVDPVGASYSVDDATRIKLRYRLIGAVQRSSAGARRGVATTTALTVTPAQPRDVRVVRSQEVLSLSCAAPNEEPAPCGEPGGDDQWRVELTGADTGARVLAVVTIPS